MSREEGAKMGEQGRRSQDGPVERGEHSESRVSQEPQGPCRGLSWFKWDGGKQE